MAQRYEKSEFLSFASCQLIASSNEDRVAATLNHKTVGDGKFSSFGVFDGHQGDQAAQRCATTLNELAIHNYQKLLRLRSTEKAEVLEIVDQSGCLQEDTSAQHCGSNNPDEIDDSTQKDALICESVRRACASIGKEYKYLGESGSTVSSLIMRWDTDEENSQGSAGTFNCPVRVYCSNVGDSRCVMLKTYDTKDILVASTFGHISKSSSASQETNVVPPLQHSLSLDRNQISFKNKSKFGPVPSSSAKSNKFVAVHLMSEDHKLSLHRERLRIISATDGKAQGDNERNCWHVLPADGSAIYLPQYAKTPPPIFFRGLPPIPIQLLENDDFEEVKSGPFGRRAKPDPLSSSSCHGYVNTISMLEHDASLHRASCHGHGLGYSTHSVIGRSNHSLNQSMHSNHSLHNNPIENSATSKLIGSGLNKYFIFDWGYPSKATVDAATLFIDTVAGIPPIPSIKSVGSGLELKDLNSSEHNGDPAEPPLCYQLSFIQKRSATSGRATGPEALFSRHNTSIMMTRSIGDRYGPRCCIAVPEISAYTVPPGTHARFILASDGFWDVVSVEAVRCVGLSDKYKDPRVLALQLAQKAQRRRDRGGLRMDDITVLVVDVNPANMISISGKNGGDGLNNGKEKCTIS